MASYFVHEPTDSYTVADQHLIYELETDSTVDDAFRYVITVYQGTITGTLLGKFYLTPNPSEIGMFNLAEAVRGLCQVDDRTYGGTTVVHSLLANYFTRSNGNIKHFTVGVGEWDGSTEAINDETQGDRLGEENTLHLKPGNYVFRVTNTDVPYMLGFYLRSESVLDRPFLPSVSGGGLYEGVSKDYVIELEAGEYVYSCPLNTTPDYKLVVSDG